MALKFPCGGGQYCSRKWHIYSNAVSCCCLVVQAYVRISTWFASRKRSEGPLAQYRNTAPLTAVLDADDLYWLYLAQKSVLAETLMNIWIP